MRLSHWMLFLGLLAATGCSSTLEEFRCTENIQCVDEQGAGMCHASGYCAFLDTGGCDGFRFGKLSGERSGQCVGDEGQDIDAGLSIIDASTGNIDAGADDLLPTATIDPINLACGDTTISLDGRDSSAVGEATLVGFNWTLRSPSGTVINTLNGAPGDVFRQNANFIAGLGDQPVANLTLYKDDKALFVDTDEDFADIFQGPLSIPAGSHRLSFAVASAPGENVSADFVFLVGRDENNIIAQDAINLTFDMTTYTLDFTNLADVPDASVFFYTNSGEYWLDNVVLQRFANGSSDSPPLLSNASFETGLSPWLTDLDNPSAVANVQALPPYLTQYGEYQIELIVKDSNENASAPAILTLNHEPCP